MDSALAAYWHRKKVAMADGLSGRSKEVFEGVVAQLERVAAEGGKLAVKDALVLVPCTQSEWTYAQTRVKAMGLTDMLERYRAAAEKTRTIGHGYGGKSVRAEKVEPVRPYEEVQCYLKNNAKDGTSEEDACRATSIDFGEYLLDKEKALGSVTPHPALVPSPKLDEVVVKPRRVPAMDLAAPYINAPKAEPVDSETVALMKIIMTLRPLPKEARDRIMGAATIMLGLS